MLDLHTHSTCSDGSEAPRRVVELAFRAGCSAVALTDHDSFDGIDEGRARAAELGLDFVPGCEVSCASRAGPLHLLCYFVHDDESALGQVLVRARADRARRNERIAQRLEALGIPVSLADANKEARGNVVGRPHFAAVLVRVGAARSIEEAFDRFLKRGAAAYVPREPLQADEVIRAASASRAVVSLAHPHSTDLDATDLDRLVGELASVGLSGLEAYYSGYDELVRNELVALARSHNLVPTGGSDFHGEYRAWSRIGVGAGDLEVPDGILRELEARLA
ncbi:MAG TPA: PHP domain-containing protein [Acidimicrobiales bacterium]|nr:PHP domain-containing protein [Acidimicrobiales bacterium]